MISDNKANISAVTPTRDGAPVTRPHPRTIGWFGITSVAMGGINQSLFLMGALFIGQEAVDFYRDNHKNIHVVILDMTMPKLTGKQTMKKILEINPKAKIILASGYTMEGTPEDLMKLGALDFLHKPYTIAPLAKSLQAVLASRN